MSCADGRTGSVDEPGEPVDEAALRMMLEGLQPDLDRVRQQTVVGVEKEHELSGGLCQSSISPGADSRSLDRDTSRTGNAQDDVDRSVGRPIVDHDDLEGRNGLGECALDRFAYVASVVMARDHYRHSRRGWTWRHHSIPPPRWRLKDTPSSGLRRHSSGAAAGLPHVRELACGGASRSHSGECRNRPAAVALGRRMMAQTAIDGGIRAAATHPRDPARARSLDDDAPAAPSPDGFRLREWCHRSRFASLRNVVAVPPSPADRTGGEGVLGALQNVGSHVLVVAVPLSLLYRSIRRSAATRTAANRDVPTQVAV